MFAFILFLTIKSDNTLKKSRNINKTRGNKKKVYLVSISSVSIEVTNRIRSNKINRINRSFNDEMYFLFKVLKIIAGMPTIKINVCTGTVVKYIKNSKYKSGKLKSINDIFLKTAMVVCPSNGRKNLYHELVE